MGDTSGVLGSTCLKFSCKQQPQSFQALPETWTSVMVVIVTLLGILNCQLKYSDANLCIPIRRVYYKLIAHIFDVKLALKVKVGEEEGVAGIEPKNGAKLYGD